LDPNTQASPASQPAKPSVSNANCSWAGETRGIHGRDRYVCRLCPTAPAEYSNLSPVTPLKLLPASRARLLPTTTQRRRQRPSSAHQLRRQTLRSRGALSHRTRHSPYTDRHAGSQLCR
jgi:hypothetical protein